MDDRKRVPPVDDRNGVPTMDDRNGGPTLDEPERGAIRGRTGKGGPSVDEPERGAIRGRRPSVDGGHPWTEAIRGRPERETSSGQPKAAIQWTTLSGHPWTTGSGHPWITELVDMVDVFMSSTMDAAVHLCQRFQENLHFTRNTKEGN